MALLSMLSSTGSCKGNLERIMHWFCALYTRWMELAIGDAFKLSKLNSQCQEDVKNVYYLFKKATLRWRLFKQQVRCNEIHYLRYKRPTGTRWTEHQAAALGSYNTNLPLLIGYCNNQIADPYNDTMKKAVPKL